MDVAQGRLRHDSGEGMRYAFGQRNGFLGAGQSLVGIASQPQNLRRRGSAANAGIVPAIDISQGMVPVGMIDRDAIIRMVLGGVIVSQVILGGPLLMMRL